MWNDIDQNCDEWLDLRSGRVTGSAISKIMANYGKAFGEPAKKYAVDIAIEMITGKPILSNYTNDHMERGHQQESIARMLYEGENFCDVSKGGFFDNGFTGCSPDGLIESEGVIEIKSVIPSVQYATLKRGAPDPAYRWQLSFNLKESGRDWIDYVSFCADFPDGKQLIIHRLTKDDLQDDFASIDNRLGDFRLLVDSIKNDIGDSHA